MSGTAPAPRGLVRGGGIPLALVSASLFVDSLLYSVVVPVLPAYTRGLGVSAAGIGALFAAYAVGLVLAAPAFGVVADRLGRRRPMLWGSFGIAGATLLFSAADDYVLLLVARLLQGVAAAAVWTAGVALLADVIPRARLGRAMGVAMTAMSAGLILGPPFGGILVETAGHQAPFQAATAVAVVIGALQLALLRDAPRGAGAPVALRRLVRDRALLATLGGVALGAAALSMLEPVLPLDLADRLGADARTIGMLFGLAALANGIASPLAGMLADRFGAEPLIAGALVVMGALLPPIAVAGSLPTTAILLTAFAIAFAFVLVPALPQLARIVERRGGMAYAAVYGVFNLAYAVGMVAGPSAGGAATSATSLAVTFAATGAVLCVGGLLLLLAHVGASCAGSTSIPSRSTP